MPKTRENSFLRCTAVLIVSAPAVLMTAFGQMTSQPTTPRVGDPEVYASFFTLHNDFMKWVDDRKTMNPAKGQNLDQRVAEIHHINSAELPNVTEISREVLRDLNKLEAERHAYVEKSKSQNGQPDPKVLRDYQVRRSVIVLSGVLKLKRTLSPASWDGLNSYINNQHRLKIRQISGAAN